MSIDKKGDRICDLCGDEIAKSVGSDNNGVMVLVELRDAKTGDLIKGSKCLHDDICDHCRDKIMTDCKKAMLWQEAHNNYYKKLDKSQCCFGVAQFGKESTTAESGFDPCMGLFLPPEEKTREPLTIEEYSNTMRDLADYPIVFREYPMIGLVGEFGELLNQYKKIYRDDNNTLTEERKNKMITEMGGMLWYINEILWNQGLKLWQFSQYHSTPDGEENTVYLSTTFERYEEQLKLTRTWKISSNLDFTGLLKEIHTLLHRLWEEYDDREFTGWACLGLLHKMAVFCDHFDFSIAEVARANYDQLISRRKKGTLHGDQRGDD